MDEAGEKPSMVFRRCRGDIPSPVNPPSGCGFHSRCSMAKDICKREVPEWREIETKHWVACHFA
ncbi:MULTISPECIES: oligopeptide/dipeptide ABC transporter ATP-binding protein [Aminobacterium]|uniref:oligopeptide/dipeptide ABC transporter ATP-binding protein n=2 Tax=Aminobacterium TaxID=81466 RepID=UPI00257D77D9|nr:MULTISPECIES: oligopeptide/dipeptide ABC transporter ATP-binding protein [unclassified Aminobacterium]